MSFFSKLTETLTGRTGGGDGSGTGSSPVGAILDMLSNPQTGGLQGVLQRFNDNGFGNVVQSWVGTGQNQPITPQQIMDAMGPDHVKALADKVGLPVDQFAPMLAEHLPNIVDHLTPNGQVPEGGLLQQGLGLLRNKLPT